MHHAAYLVVADESVWESRCPFAFLDRVKTEFAGEACREQPHAARAQPGQDVWVRPSVQLGTHAHGHGTYCRMLRLHVVGAGV